MTTKLIKELVGLCVEKRLFMVESDNIINASCYLRRIRVHVDLLDVDAPQQLQAAIDKVKAL